MNNKDINLVDTSNVKRVRSIQGKVVSNSMNKTLRVLVERKVKHPILGKYLVRSKRYNVHNELGEFNIGDTVEISECRPISKTKSWRVVQAISRAKGI
ncbi:MAG: 30S ribosomal protein S17 [Betaproteobacteria bacterium TMED156]|mgnify:CR=1 FL=1|nr:MAG: 30S ribosomal protein S17 [Betaproteobacteria bacterium TMED156]|tara:strand:- start:69 stop:362 length:294 start_codon:yes stop_codon:yes gene_type:complete